MTKKKRHQIESPCPQCGCANIPTLSEEEVQKRYKDVPNIDLECHECMEKYEAEQAAKEK
ncbi:MAG: hypothetical protein CSA42_00410 [Gammaproteobacteria bacterium]|nr:MAG: hypothetical protein CSB21_00110 [Deltaproteobacteria bacterium]PIE48149.1 MAG: hypothetical protein CSA42_00410 [Gammaproteobacteria bacterium]